MIVAEATHENSPGPQANPFRAEFVWGVYFEEWVILVPLYSVLSVYSVVLAGKITTEYAEDTEKTLNKKSKNP